MEHPNIESSAGSKQELCVEYINSKNTLLKVLTFMDAEGYSSTDAYRLGALAFTNNFTKSEIISALNFDDQSYRNALTKLKRWISKWNFLTQNNLEAA